MKIHPAIVHFPIALLAVAGILAIVSLFIKKESLKEWMFKNLALGLILIPFAIIAGLIEEQDLQHNEAIHSVLITHKFNGFIVFIVFAILTVWFWKRKNLMKNREYTTWVLCLLLGTGLLSYQGYLGGKMVFDLGAGIKPMEQFMTKDHSHGDEDESSPSHNHNNEGKEASDTSSHADDHKMKEHSHDQKQSSDTTNAQKKKKKELKDMKY